MAYKTYTTFNEWALDSNPDAPVVYTVELTARKLSDDSTVTLYLSTHGGEWDGSHYFKPTVKTIPKITRKVNSVTGGASYLSCGELILSLDQAAYFDSANTIDMYTLFEDYTFYSQDVVIKVGGVGLSYSLWGTVMDGYVGVPQRNDFVATLPVLSKTASLAEVTIPPGEYDDTYPSSTEGQAIPLCYGECKNISPVLIDDATSTAYYTYQFHDPTYGPVQSIDAVYVDGIATAPAATNLTNATVSFSGDPGGTVTLDVKGGKVSGTYISLPAEIIAEWVVTFGGYTTGDLVTAAFTQHETDVPFDVGIYINSQTTLGNAITDLLAGLFSNFEDTREGKFTISKTTAPTGTADLEITDTTNLVQKDGNLDFTSVEPILWRVEVQGDRNHTVITNPNASVTADYREWLKSAFRSRSAEDTSVLTTYPYLATTAIQQTHLVDLDDCETVAGWWLAFYKVERWRVKVRVDREPLALDKGAIVDVISDAPGTVTALKTQIVEFSEVHELGMIDLELWS